MWAAGAGGVEYLVFHYVNALRASEKQRTYTTTLYRHGLTHSLLARGRWVYKSIGADLALPDGND